MRTRPGWYFRRAVAMTWAERLHRAHHAMRTPRWRGWAARGLAPVFRCTPPTDVRPWPPCKPDPGAEKIREDAAACLRHEWHFFDLDGQREETIDWHRDPAAGRAAPRRFGFDIDHHDAARVGNIKSIWEKNRHHHLTVLALACHVTGDVRFSREVAAQLTSWMEQNPFLVGVNWTHPLEHGVRLIAWVWCERLLRGTADHTALFGPGGSMWPAVHRHQWFIERTYARGSSANNHLIGEMAGLFVAASAWPYFPESAAWRRRARRILERQIRIQTFPDGLNREMAFAYHLFTAEFFLLALYEARRAGAPVSEEYVARLRGMVEAVPALTDAGGNLPRYGDDDEGVAVRLGPRGGRREAWILAAGRRYAGARVAEEDPEPLPLHVLRAGETDPPPASALAMPPSTTAFPDAGVYVLASRRHTPREIFVLADAGPHGYLSIAAHAHADALSFTLSAAGLPILVDPGTFVYHTQPVWRDYFRATRAHNTIEMHGRDQSDVHGPFLWANQARTRVVEWAVTPSGARLCAWHDGYRRLGVRHRRTWALDGETLRITDDLEGSGSHPLAIRFHLAPECRVAPTADHQIRIRRDGMNVCLTLPGEFAIEQVRGGEEAGWYSPRFGVRIETLTLIGRAVRALPDRIETEITVHHED